VPTVAVLAVPIVAIVSFADDVVPVNGVDVLVNANISIHVDVLVDVNASVHIDVSIHVDVFVDVSLFLNRISES
jgi:hypothetical protein